MLGGGSSTASAGSIFSTCSGRAVPPIGGDDLAVEGAETGRPAAVRLEPTMPCRSRGVARRAADEFAFCWARSRLGSCAGGW
jgi:hypothetical protein